MKNDNFTFDEVNHLYTLDGKPLMGITSILQVIAKPFLIQWSANMAVEYIDDEFCKISVDYDKPAKFFKALETEWPRILSEAKVAHRKKKEKAGDWGTEVHKAIENWIKKDSEITLQRNNQQLVFNKFKDWAKENNVEFIESEKRLYSRVLWTAGTCDLILKVNGKKYVGDIKTSSGIYDEAFFQMGGYHIMLDEMGEHKDIEGYIVINLKKDGTMDFKIATDTELNRQAFRSALNLYRIINSLK